MDLNRLVDSFVTLCVPLRVGAIPTICGRAKDVVVDSTLSICGIVRSISVNKADGRKLMAAAPHIIAQCGPARAHIGIDLRSAAPIHSVIHADSGQ
jgi:hypothetical protein